SVGCAPIHGTGPSHGYIIRRSPIVSSSPSNRRRGIVVISSSRQQNKRWSRELPIRRGYVNSALVQTESQKTPGIEAHRSPGKNTEKKYEKNFHGIESHERAGYNTTHTPSRA